MDQQPNFETAVEAMTWLKQQGYREDFNLDYNCIRSGSTRLAPDDFGIEHIFRIEGATDPGDEAVVYGIASPKTGIKGILINAYGAYADEMTDEMIRKLKSS